MPAVSASSSANTMPRHQQRAEPAHHRHRRELQDQEPDRGGERGGGDRRRGQARGAHRVPLLLRLAPGTGSRSRRQGPSSTGSTAIEAIVSGAPTTRIAPNVTATAASATASGTRRRRLRNTSTSTSAITTSATTSSRSTESVSARGEVVEHHRDARDRVAALVELPLGHRHRRADLLDRVAPLVVGEARLQPHLDQRRLRAREQVREARLRRPRPARGVEHQRGDEVRVVERRRAGQPEAVAQVDLQEVAQQLAVDDLARGVRRLVLLRPWSARARRPPSAPPWPPTRPPSRWPRSAPGAGSGPPRRPS